MQLRERGVAILMATHDVELVAQVATRVLLLGDGGIVAQGGTREVLAGSLTFGTQMNRVFGNGWLTVDDVVRGQHRGLGHYADELRLPEWIDPT